MITCASLAVAEPRCGDRIARGTAKSLLAEARFWLARRVFHFTSRVVKAAGADDRRSHATPLNSGSRCLIS